MNPHLNLLLAGERARELAEQPTPRRRGRWLGRGVLAGVLAACALAADASAATVEIQGNDVLRYRGGSDRNTLSVRENADSLTVSDSSGVSNIFIPVTDPRPRCAVIDSRTLRCPLTIRGRAVKRLDAELGDGSDRATSIHTQLPVTIDGGLGNDTYEAGTSPFLSRVEFRGGGSCSIPGCGGLDSASYAGAGQTAQGEGVRISNDGVADDGRPGLDADNIGRDVESLVGSRFNDELTGAGGDPDQLCCRPRRPLVGGPGDDVLRGGSGDFTVVFDMGAAADGADKIIAGTRPSIIDYGSRSRPVKVSLASGSADNGESGERDQILGRHEGVVGGQAGDTLTAARFSTTPAEIDGSGGNDAIDGADGDDTLVGGAGADVIRAFGGDDQVLAADADRDVAGCGTGTDRITFDSRDQFEACESRRLVGQIGALRLTPRTLRARAGETARLSLRWRHPRSWKQLRRVELRLYDGSERVGRVTVRIRDGRIVSRDVRLVRRASRVARKGKTVSARLALRLDRSLAGRRLRLEVEAVDAGGARQLERSAGSFRVAD
jgi:RTX calcium-binding nonapeptide repeat (4 copies)